jgi:hypothetical protein
MDVTYEEERTATGDTTLVRKRAPARPARGDDRSARALGWFSIAVGAGELIAAEALARALGRRGGSWARLAVGAIALRELSSGLAVLRGLHPGVATAADLVTRINRARVQAQAAHIGAAISVNRPRGEVETFWRGLDSATTGPLGEVRFLPGPGGGTEIHVNLETTARGRQQVTNELRRCKQLLELGEITHSDASIHSGPHPARPPEEE